VTAPLRHAIHAPGWGLRNLWGLLALPLATAAALVASSDRVQLYFWEEGLRRPTSGPSGQWVSFQDSYTDSNGDHQRLVRVRLDTVRPTTTPWLSSSPLQLPPGTRALAVTLSLEADPNLPLSVCSLAIRDADGNRYDYLRAFGGMDQPTSPCVPSDAPGPNAAMGEFGGGADPEDKPRPARWTVSPVIVLPAGVTPTEVDLWWEMPKYVSLAIPS
jgi:hypothetical protein